MQVIFLIIYYSIIFLIMVVFVISIENKIQKEKTIKIIKILFNFCIRLPSDNPFIITIIIN